MKVIQISDGGFVWHLPLSVVAHRRAEYYAAHDPDTTYEDEFAYIMDDDYEGIDWYLNNMDFCDVAAEAVLVRSPVLPPEPGPDAECRMVTAPEQNEART